MAQALEVGIPHASAREVGDWVEEVGGDSLRRRAEHVAAIESHSAANAPASYADEPTLTRSDVGAVIIAESSANRNSAPAAMARSLTSTGRISSAPPPARATMPSVPTGSGARSVRVALSSSVGEDEDALPQRKRTWMLFPLLLVLLGGAYVVYMRFNPARRAAPEAQGSTERATNAGATRPEPATATIPPPPAVIDAPVAAAAPAVTASASAAPTASVAIIATGAPVPAKPWKPWQPASPPASPHVDGSGSPAPAVAAPSTAAAHECEVPYTIDTQGIRHPKPQCL
jgi:hypothetical protein